MPTVSFSLTGSGRGKRFKVQERKLIVGNSPPYGYCYVKKDRHRGIEGRYVLDPDEARVVHEMFNWVANEGLTQRAVIRRLRDLGIRSRKGGRWASSSIHRILTNETYTGVTYYGKHRCISAPPPPAGSYHRHHMARERRDRSEWLPIPLPAELHLISKELFDRVQAQLVRNSAHARRNAKRLYVLREVRKTCAACGWTLGGTTHHQTRYYRCRGKNQLELPVGKQRCSSTIFNAERLEAAVWRAVERAVLNPDLILTEVRKLHEERSITQEAVELKSKAIGRSLAQLQQEEDRTLEAYRRGILSVTQLDRELEKISHHRAALQQQLDAADKAIPSIPSLPVASQTVENWVGQVRERLCSFNDGEKARFLGHLLNEIVIGPESVLIRGEIPSRYENGSDVDTAGVPQDQDVSNPEAIALTPSYKREHNTTVPFEFLIDLPRIRRWSSRRLAA